MFFFPIIFYVKWNRITIYYTLKLFKKHTINFVFILTRYLHSVQSYSDMRTVKSKFKIHTIRSRFVNAHRTIRKTITDLILRTTRELNLFFIFVVT